MTLVSNSRGAVTVFDLTDRRVVVIGGAGFIGSHVVEQLTREPLAEIVVLDNFVRGSRANLAEACRDPRVRIVEGSITDRPLVRDLLQGTDCVFHLAALWLHECVHDPRAALDVNVVGTFNVLEAAQQTGVKKLVYSSSASVYGEALATMMTEDHPFNNRTMYGATKIAGEQLCRTFYDRHRLDYIGLRYMNVYGPRMDDRGAYVSVVIKVLDRLDRGLPPIVFGDGSQTYDFVHVQDVARANVLAVKSDATDGFVNIGTGVPTTIRELVSLLLRLRGSTLDPEFHPDAAMFVTHRVGSTEKAQRLLGFHWDVPLEDGLRSVLAWRARAQSSTAGASSIGLPG